MEVPDRPRAQAECLDEKRSYGDTTEREREQENVILTNKEGG